MKKLKRMLYILIIFIASLGQLYAQDGHIIKPLLLNMDICTMPIAGDIYPLSDLEGNLVINPVYRDSCNENPSCYYQMRYYLDEKWSLEKDRLKCNYWDDIYISNNYDYNNPCAISLYTDKYKELFFYGQLAIKDTIINNKIAYVNFPQGKWEIYYRNAENSRLKIKEIHIKDGHIIGKYKVWDSTGKLLYQADATDKRDWYMKDFYPSGKLRVEGLYEEGLREGLWTWYDLQGNIEVREFYERGIIKKRLQPYVLTLDFNLGDTSINTGFVIQEELCKNIFKSRLIYWDQKQKPFILIADTTGINLYVCVFGHIPEQVKLKDIRLTANNNLCVNIALNRGPVYGGLFLWENKYPVEVDTSQVIAFDIPLQLKSEYFRMNYKYLYNSTPGMKKDLSSVIPFPAICSILKENETVNIDFLVSGNRIIKKISHNSKYLNKTQLDKISILLSPLIGRKVPVHNIDYNEDIIYKVTVLNLVNHE